MKKRGKKNKNVGEKKLFVHIKGVVPISPPFFNGASLASEAHEI